MTLLRTTRLAPPGALLLLACLPVSCSAQIRALSATVLWTRGDLVYIAARDSTTLGEGDRLTFLHRGKPIAAGEVERVLEGDLRAARLTSGSLSRISRLDRVRIAAEPALPHALSRLRLGYPSSRRVNLLFMCAGDSVASPAALYRRDSPDGDEPRLVGDRQADGPSAWPDTLLIRYYDESADEEIALERGEIDAAIFWPGELSPHMRASRMWQEPLFGTRSRGVLAAIFEARDSLKGGDVVPPDRALLEQLNRQLFGGDLLPLDPRPGASARDPLRPEPRYAGDASLPGQWVIEAVLNRGRPPVRRNAVDARLAYLDVAAASVDSLVPRTTPWFAIRCPVVCAPELRATVRSLGTDHLVNMLVCVPAGRRP